MELVLFKLVVLAAAAALAAHRALALAKTRPESVYRISGHPLRTLHVHKQPQAKRQKFAACHKNKN